MADEILRVSREAPPDDALWARILGVPAGPPAAAEAPPAPAATERPSILGAGGQAFTAGMGKIARGGRRMLEGTEGAGDLGLFEIVNGVFQSTLGVPLAMAGTAAEHLLPGSVRSRELDVPLTPEQRQRLAGVLNVAMGLLGADITSVQQMEATFSGSAPLTYGDAVNLATQTLAAPAAAGGAVAVGLKGARARRGKAGAEPIPGATDTTAPRRADPGVPAEAPVAPTTIAELASRPEVPPLGPAAPEVPPRVNLARIGAPEHITALIADVNQRVSGRVADLGGAVPQPHAETIARARALGLTVEKALSDEFLAGQSLADLRPMGVAIRDLRDAAFGEAERLQQAAVAGDVTAGERLPVAMALAGELEARRTLFSGEVGGALEAHKIVSQAGRAERFDPDALAQLAQEIATGAEMDGFALAERMGKLPTAQQQRSFIQNLAVAVKAGNKAFHAIWLQNLLTGAKTHVANIGGTALATLWEVPERTVAGTINQLLFKDPRGVQIQEAVAVMQGLVEGPADGIRLMGKAWREKREPFGPTLVERRLSAESLELDPQTTVGRTVDTLGVMIDTYGPGRWLITEDAFFKGVNARMELKALAVRQALAEDLRYGTEPFDRRVARLEAQPTARMWAEVKDAAALRTMNAEPGPAGALLMQVRDHVPGLPYVLAFMRTPMNVGKWAYQRGPITSLISPDNLRALLHADQNPAARDRALAKMAIGNSVGAWIAYQVTQGTITGSGPSDRTKRINMQNLGWSRNAVRVGDQLYGYGRGADPMGVVVGGIADFVEMGSQLPQDSPWWQQWGVEFPLVAGQAIGHQVINKTYMQGLAELIETIKEPDRRAHRLAQGFARSLVPTGLRDLAKEIDPATKHITSMLEAMKAGVPGWSLTVAPNQNHVTGEVIYYPPGWGPDLVSPVTLTTLKDDPVLREIVDHDIGLAPPGDYLGGRRVAAVLLREPTPQDGIFIDGWTRKRLIDLATQEVRDGNGQTLHQHLATLVRTWEGLPPDDQPASRMRARLFRTAYDRYYDEAERRLLEERNDLQAAVVGKKAERLLDQLSPRQQREATPAVRDITDTLRR